MPTSDYLINLETRRQVILERFKAGEVRQFEQLLRDLAREIRVRLLSEDLTAFSRARQNALLADIGSLLSGGLDNATGQLQRELLDAATDEAQFAGEALNRSIRGFDSVIPPANQVRAAVLSSPLSVRGPDGGKLLESWVKDWSAYQVTQVQGAIRRGFFEGQTNQQMISSVVGSLSNNYADGEFARIKRSLGALIRTGVQHTAMVARTETLKENGVERYEWLSTLDDRTSPQCQVLDGQIFEWGKGPTPPIHPNCRSSITAVLPDKFQFLREGAERASVDGPVSAEQTYYGWLKKQPASFQEEALGPTWAKVFRDGGVDADEFARLRLGKNFQPITLEQLREKRPAIFEEANI